MNFTAIQPKLFGRFHLHFLIIWVIQGHYDNGWFRFAKVTSDQIRLSGGSHLIRVLVYLSEREQSAGRAGSVATGALPLFTCLGGS